MSDLLSAVSFTSFTHHHSLKCLSSPVSPHALSLCLKQPPHHLHQSSAFAQTSLGLNPNAFLSRMPLLSNPSIRKSPLLRSSQPSVYINEHLIISPIFFFTFYLLVCKPPRTRSVLYLAYCQPIQ